jgi:small subunit ribosomal protein S21
MSYLEIEDGEDINIALKKFKKKVQKAGIISEVRRRERFEKPSEKRKRKREASQKRRR